MDFITCKICSVPYDEEEHRPRNPACGHELCSSCIRAIIRDSIFECPKCREKNKVYAPEDLQSNFGLIGVIRAFKAPNFSISNESQTSRLGATNDEICKVHNKLIRHRCFKCLVWICEDQECLDSHSSDMGCSTITSIDAVKSIKEKHSTEIKDILITFKDDSKYFSNKIQEHTDKRKEHLELAEKHGEEIRKIKKVIEDGNFHKEKMVESENHLNATDSPNTVSERNDVLIQRKQLLRSWSTKNKGVELTVKSNGAESADSVTGKLKIEHMQRLALSDSTQVFVELSFGGCVKGKICINLHNGLHNIKKHMLNIVTGRLGKSLAGLKLTHIKFPYLYIASHDLPFVGTPVTPDTGASSTIKRGDVVGYFSFGYLSSIRFHIDTHDYGDSGMKVMGTIASGLDLLQDCYDNARRGNTVTITDCGMA